jgi:cobalt-zinc-cadmium efflux system membrane fusion protein
MNSERLLLLAVAMGLVACGGSEPPSAASSTQAPTEQAVRGTHAEGEHAEGEENEHGAANGKVELTDEQIQRAGIALVQAGPATIRETLPVYGLVVPNAERVRDVVARFPGVIRSLNKRIGDEVRQGERLASVESNESLQTYAVAAPINGVVTARNANPGEHTGEKVLFTIADLSTVWVELSLFPRDLGKVRVGQSVRVESSDANVTGEGKIVYLAPFGSSTNQTLTARVQLENKDRRWAPGLYVTAAVTLAESQVPLAISSEALQTLETNTVVFVRNESGFEARVVRTGRSDGESVEIVDGLQVGETYAAEHSFIVKAELGKGSAEHED